MSKLYGDFVCLDNITSGQYLVKKPLNFRSTQKLLKDAEFHTQLSLYLVPTSRWKSLS